MDWDTTQRRWRRHLRHQEFILNGLHSQLFRRGIVPEDALVRRYHFHMGRRRFILQELLKKQIKEFNP